MIKARDRHVRVPWPALRHQLLNMAAVARTHARYMALRLGGSFYITDNLTQVRRPQGGLVRVQPTPVSIAQQRTSRTRHESRM